MIKLTTPHRDSDSWGSGAFHASRGSHVHQGVDFLAAARSKVHAILPGTITKLGVCYSDTTNFRYVEITDKDGYRLRYFYVKSTLRMRDEVKTDDVIGYVQNLDTRYKGIPNHIHFEIKEPLGSDLRIDPEEYIKEFL